MKQYLDVYRFIFVQPVLYFALCFIATIWMAIYWQISFEYTEIARNVRANTSNIARLFEESVERSLAEVDQTLKYVRQIHYMNGEKTNWIEILNQGYTINNRSVHLAVIDANGFQIANSLTRSTPDPIYFGDREHFATHLRSSEDTLFLSKPAIIPHSGRRSIHLTRSFRKADGSFGGVIVASFDPSYFARIYSGLHLGRDSGIALIGTDGIIRAGAGIYADELAKNVQKSKIFEAYQRQNVGTSIELAKNQRSHEISSFRPIGGYAQIVVVTANDAELNDAWKYNSNRYILSGVFVNILIILAAARMIYTSRHLQKTSFALAQSVEVATKKTAELALTTREFSLTLSNMTQGILMVDNAGMVAVINERLCALLELPENIAKQRMKYDDLVNKLSESGEYDKEDACIDKDIRSYILNSCATGHIASYERTRPNGVILEVCTQSIPEGGFVRTFTDITERRRHEAQIIFIARHDQLTGLGNRVMLQEEMEKILSRQGQEPFSLKIIDLDGFKPVNDTFGHPVGDKLLTRVAERLRCNLRQKDLIARLGGDEFAVVELNDGKSDQAGVTAERLCGALSEPYIVDGHKLEVSASVGIALFPRDGRSHQDLLKAADLALYCAKAEGKSTYRFYNEEMQTFAIRRRSIEEGLKRAIAENRFELHYQPICCANSLRVEGYEALIRWRDLERGFIPPSDFIPLAEETGLIIKMGAWAIDRACHDIAQLSNTLRVAVNLSPVQFRDPEIVSTVRQAIQSSGIDPQRLEIEITESAIMQNDAVTLKRLDELRDLKISLSIDDFGTGYSSFSYLQQYPIDRIKIDRSFVSGLPANKNSIAIIKAITALASALGMKTIAEGIETQEQLDILRDLACNEVQGFLFAKPKSILEIYDGGNIRLCFGVE
jgi:diguanylate cyclase (GGDEF)-like protein